MELNCDGVAPVEGAAQMAPDAQCCAQTAASAASAASGSEGGSDAPPEMAIASRSLELSEAVQAQMRAEDFCVNTLQWAAGKIRAALTRTDRKLEAWAPSQPMDVKRGWLEDLDRAAGRVVPPRSTVVVVGDTGAGKNPLRP